MSEALQKASLSSVTLAPAALSEITSILSKHAVKRVFLVVDPVASAASGADTVLADALNHCEVTPFSKFQLNPKLEDVQRGIALFRDNDPEMVIALGGGTAIDLAKMIGTLAVQSNDARAIVLGHNQIQCDGPPLVAVPTTAGTGSEATHFAVVYVDGDKYSLADPTLLPDYALVDPLLTHSLPARITAATGLDAFCQAIESLWAVGATEESCEYATQAALLSIGHLVSSVQNPTPESRMAMCQASHLAGKAIDISKTTASHALSYPLTSLHGLPHGIAVALTLAPMLGFNSEVTAPDCVDPRGVDYVRRRISTIVDLLGATDVPSACKKIRSILSDTGCPASLVEAGITHPSQWEQIIRGVNAERMSNNPRRTTSDSLLRLLSESNDDQ
ncbi:bifunctional acetaldehyde-CoA/alcohol dehydrogenase [Rhodopirellula maiorica SM1]|uniref:Bifunctional acetaldehyde-CoA/alcohol dehydrogenase n=1 Tax=Rhodopirellula maiorica SM1 TaxID=1265738 RepID=M5S7A9_9BACT|nr:phosphonoacetaldehyde reductase [Rhodopirellula maiorica]EMI22074.1 bifunctional acetaldehyde-CoA/alcohol dehydrogenase [Rhodopirellula maiorica SM1]